MHKIVKLMENVILWNVTCFNIASMEDYFNSNKIMIKGVHNFLRRFAIILIIKDFIICCYPYEIDYYVL